MTLKAHLLPKYFFRYSKCAIEEWFEIEKFFSSRFTAAQTLIFPLKFLTFYHYSSRYFVWYDKDQYKDVRKNYFSQRNRHQTGRQLCAVQTMKPTIHTTVLRTVLLPSRWLSPLSTCNLSLLRYPWYTKFLVKQTRLAAQSFSARLRLSRCPIYLVVPKPSLHLMIEHVAQSTTNLALQVLRWISVYHTTML